MSKFGPFNYEFELSKRNYDFETQIDNIVVNTQNKLLAVVQQALGDTIEEMNTTVDNGGKMRVDTGFLRNSGVAQINSIPVGPSTGRKRKSGEVGILSEYSDDNTGPIGVKLAELELGDIFYFGWTARYAEIREAYDGFLESALSNWQTNVDNAVNKLKGR